MDGRLARAWEKERRSWVERPGYWRFYAVLTAFFLFQTGLASSWGEGWAIGFCVLATLLTGLLATLAYRAAHAR